jgi:allophanate hydrolase
MKVDLNADMGEGFGDWPMGDDATLLGIVTSANVACGKHAGDWDTMAATMRLAHDNGVGIGAHPGFPDLQGFGRRRMDLRGDSLGNLVAYQVGAARGMAASVGARSAHLAAGLGALIVAGDELPLGEDRTGRETGLVLPTDDRFEGGAVRVVPGFQTGFFPDEERARFEATPFTRAARGNRMGVRFDPDGEGFASAAGLSVLSEVIVPGDIQITGDGAPFVLMAECQTTGGYPRIGSVLPCDLPRVAQAQPGARLRFRFVTEDDGIAAERTAATARKGLRAKLDHLVRDPHDIRDLLSYQFISGVTAGHDEET